MTTLQNSAKSREDISALIEQALQEGGPSGAAEACVQALTRLRAMDRAGAVGVVANDSQLGRLLAGAVEAGSLAKRLLDLAGSRSCLGCATCCRTSSPTLYAEDGDLVQGGGLPREGLFTLRQGQKAYSARLQSQQVLPGELIKVRERAQGAAFFWRETAAAFTKAGPYSAAIWSAGPAAMPDSCKTGPVSAGRIFFARTRPPWT
jgi:hypothetical protein